jgi:D-alanyl-D-alanine carboxypeptidase
MLFKKYMLKVSYLLILFIFCKFNAVAQKKDDYSSKIDSLIQVKNPRIFNGVILITQNGTIKYSKANGYSNFEKKIFLNKEDKFIIMSNSKQITAVMILKEVEKGNIDLNISIKKYLPHLDLVWKDSITVHQLLNFTSGIDEINKPLIYKPGSDYNYNNANYALLGKILEKIHKKSYSEVANNFFKDLKMKNTQCYNPGKKQNIVTNYNNYDNEMKLVDERVIVPSYNIPAAGIISNVKDLNIWDDKLHNSKILNENTYNLLLNYQVKAQHNAFGKEKIGYGYGIRIHDLTENKYYGHTGGGDGFLSYKIYFPKNKLSVIVLENQTNKDNNLNYSFEIQLRDIILNSNLMD